MHKYPRTRHLETSKFQNGDFDLDAVPFSEIKNKYIVLEEKIDGANCAILFNKSGLLLQSRGHYLRGGPREKHFDLFKQWANVHQYTFKEVLGERYIMFGEWLFAKHTEFYDQLTHYFYEFDIYDIEQNIFLSTKARRRLLEGLPIISVPVLWEGVPASLEAISGLVGPSLYKSPNWLDNLRTQAISVGEDPEKAIKHTDNSNLMEGLYIKIETEKETIDRLKYVRSDFMNSIMDQNDHWLNRIIIPNMLAKDIDIWKQ